ncbi:MAG: hypothetical protein IPK26_09000 [Planctomycetes bacterium]|nr:hypothetical protein [Planctomycetota bacterium]
MQKFTIAAVASLFALPVLGQDFIGFTYNNQIGATSRGSLAAAAGEVMTRLDGSEHSGWGRVNWPVMERRIDRLFYVVQDQDGLTPETYDICLYAEDPLNPGYPDVANPIPFAAGLPGPTNTTGGPVAAVGNIAVPGGVGVPIANECSDIFVSWKLPANAGWPATDGLSINIVLGFAPNATFLVFDTPSGAQGGTPPPSTALSNPTNSHGLYRIGAGAAAYSQRRMMFVDVAHSNSGGVGLAATNQTSFVASNNPPPAGFGPCIGTASFMSGTNPDINGFNAGRADDISMEYFKTGTGNGTLVFFLMEFDNSCVPEIPAASFVPGSTGWTCMRNPQVTCSTVTTADEACCFTAIPAALRSSLLGLPVRQQAAAFIVSTAGTVSLDLSPCDNMTF